MDEGPKKFKKEIVKAEPQRSNPPVAWDDPIDWQNTVRNEGDAYFEFRNFEALLEERGIDIRKSKVLELGSGNALLLDYLRKENVDAVGVDVDPRGSVESPQVIARIEQLPFPDETFDVLLSHKIFDSRFYDQDQAAMIQEVYRVLKPKGIFIRNCDHGKITDFPVVPGLNQIQPIKYYSTYDFIKMYQKA